MNTKINIQIASINREIERPQYIRIQKKIKFYGGCRHVAGSPSFLFWVTNLLIRPK